MSDPEHPDRGPTYHQEVQHHPATARVPEKVGLGVFSTGTIVMHGPHDFVIDFLQSLAMPRRVAARVILPPTVVPLFLAAMQDNFAKYTAAFGPLPRMPQPPGRTPPKDGAPRPDAPHQAPSGDGPGAIPHSHGPGSGGGGGSAGESEPTPFPLSHPSPGEAPPAPPPMPPISDVYDQLKLPDELLAGSYANSVVISHSPAEFCLDFITSFYPRS
ncbi:MAG: DUF3467 domain-containing protein, partial [Planctomycetaceae bacterium]